MFVDPIFWLLAAIGFVVLEAMTLNLCLLYTSDAADEL